MKKNVFIVLALSTPFLLSACGKKSEDTAATNQSASAPATETAAPTSVDQQAQINSLDKPVMDDSSASASAPAASTPAH